jgi:nucleoside-diphosphate-sugar epimerase
MRILVTGGAGFIGSHIVAALVDNNERVRVLDNFSTGRKENLQTLMNRIELVEGDVRSHESVHQAVKGIDVVLHQAALPSVPRSIHDPLTTNEVNITGTLNVLQAAKEVGVQRVVFASSSSVYGDNPTLPKQEDMMPRPLSPYAVSKLAAELYCRVFSSIFGLKTVVLRYFNVFGPRQNPNSQYAAVIPKFTKCMMADQAPIIYGDGEQSRDFTFVANVVKANILAMSADCEYGMPINCACHRRVTLNELVSSLNQVLSKNIIPRYTDPRPGEVRHSYADISRAEAWIGYKPVVSLEEGLAHTVEAMREQSTHD